MNTKKLWDLQTLSKKRQIDEISENNMIVKDDAIDNISFIFNEIVSKIVNIKRIVVKQDNETVAKSSKDLLNIHLKQDSKKLQDDITHLNIKVDETARSKQIEAHLNDTIKNSLNKVFQESNNTLHINK